jgi:hypothetical protein
MVIPMSLLEEEPIVTIAGIPADKKHYQEIALWPIYECKTISLIDTIEYAITCFGETYHGRIWMGDPLDSIKCNGTKLEFCGYNPIEDDVVPKIIKPASSYIFSFTDSACYAIQAKIWEITGTVLAFSTLQVKDTIIFGREFSIQRTDTCAVILSVVKYSDFSKVAFKPAYNGEKFLVNHSVSYQARYTYSILGIEAP